MALNSDETLSGDSGNDLINGNDDTLQGFHGNDIINGGEGK